MKKNLFLLFSVYFFVVQSIIVGLLRSEPKFYRLALINCAFICLIAILSKDDNHAGEEKFQGKYEHENIMKKNEGKKIGHFWIFLISVLFGVLVALCPKEIAMYLRILAGIAGAILVFVVGGVLFHYKPFRVWEGKLYLAALILCLIWSIISMLKIDFSVFKFESEEKIDVLSGNIVEEIDVIGGDLNSGENLILSGEAEIDNIDETNLSELEEIFGTGVDEDSLATFADVIKYLMKDETLSDKTNLSFSYISKSNPDYAYYRTAYDKKMIGTDLQPSKNLMCETFVVMKGLAQDWNVGNYTDIKQAYWNYAKNNGLLPNCEYGKYVTLSAIVGE